ncbi:hypothetical protein GOODEAATRI_023721 [Goodea atripinnis]|uniref:3-keto-steroid reductase n=1 Tax=Goodea atripinnis TaxID=208336 RepID=A0ABV0PR32_9TELE
MRKVVLVTGANSGIGLALCERLLSHDTEGLHLCLACRNMQRAQAARSDLLASHPAAQVDLLQMDTSSVSSVLSAAQEVKVRYDRLDYLYLNAGIMPNPEFDVKAFFKGLFSRLGNWSRFCATKAEPRSWFGPPLVMLTVLPLILKTYSTGQALNLTAPQNTPQTCSA